jgi:hypothetical protein
MLVPALYASVSTDAVDSECNSHSFTTVKRFNQLAGPTHRGRAEGELPQWRVAGPTHRGRAEGELPQWREVTR